MAASGAGLTTGFMAQGFDEFPLYDPLMKPGHNRLSDVWINNLSTFYQTLSAYITPFGIIPPSLTLEQIKGIISPQNGQQVYNLTVDAPQFYQASSASWRTVTFT